MWRVILREARDGHSALVTFAFACVICAAATGGLLVVDPTVVNGAPAWHKPLKFFISAALYAFTFAWYLGAGLRRGERSRGQSRLAWGLGTGIWVALGIELLLITVQAGRGVTSHFNLTTRFDAIVFNVMGMMILALTLLHVLLVIRLLRARWSDRWLLSACRWGAGIALVGLAVGALMVQPSPEQLTQLRAGGAGIAGAHTVGAPDGGAGLPLVNWSTEAGDRRVAHFVGLHAMQVIPAVALVAPAHWPAARAIAAVRVTGLAYGALTVLLILQAQQARPLQRPGTTLGIALLFIVCGWIAAMVTLGRLSMRGRQSSGS